MATWATDLPEGRTNENREQGRGRSSGKVVLYILDWKQSMHVEMCEAHSLHSFEFEQARLKSHTICSNRNGFELWNSDFIDFFIFKTSFSSYKGALQLQCTQGLVSSSQTPLAQTQPRSGQRWNLRYVSPALETKSGLQARLWFGDRDSESFNKHLPKSLAAQETPGREWGRLGSETRELANITHVNHT